jgi:hypothetical protein
MGELIKQLVGKPIDYIDAVLNNDEVCRKIRISVNGVEYLDLPDDIIALIESLLDEIDNLNKSIGT